MMSLCWYVAWFCWYTSTFSVRSAHSPVDVCSSRLITLLIYESSCWSQYLQLQFYPEHWSALKSTRVNHLPFHSCGYTIYDSGSDIWQQIWWGIRLKINSRIIYACMCLLKLKQVYFLWDQIDDDWWFKNTVENQLIKFIPDFVFRQKHG